MPRYSDDPPAPEDFRARLDALAPGDTVYTGIVNPWAEKVEDPRPETVTQRSRLTITTNRGRYWFTGRETSLHNPLFYPRVIYSIPGRTT